MIPWSATMRSALIMNCVLAMGLLTCIDAITVSIDRSDNKPPPTRSSMIANGWRPLTNGYEETIGTNVSPSSNLERNGPLHPVLGKLQEHMATSEKLKPQRKGKPTPHHDYNPPSILGSFTMLGHSTVKARGEIPSHNHLNKHVASETREYTFLIPPPKDAYRFDLDHHRKPILRDNSAYLRQPQYGPQTGHQPPDPIKAATYFIKSYTSTTNTPSSPAASSKNRHYAEPYVPQLLQPPRYQQQAKPFESLKVSNSAKPYFQPPGTALASDFGKEKRVTDFDPRPGYEKFQAPSHNDHLINPAGTGNFFSQVNHSPHSYKTSYERDPAFLVHESHEIGYITPPSVYNGFNFRPSVPYETLLPPDVYSSSTPSPTTPRESNKYQQSEELSEEQGYKRPGHSSSTKQVDHGGQRDLVSTAGLGNTYYVSEEQDLTPPPLSWPAPKNKYTSDINEVLPRVNPPSKFNQDSTGSNQIPQVPKVVYIKPQAQAPQYTGSVLPIDIRPENEEPEYETPESISLKHFNEQQYLLQQQLLQRDRQRLAEQERQQQLEIEKQQQEELKTRQEELKQLLEQQKEEEEARFAVESAKNQSQQLAKVTGQQDPYSIQLTEYEIPKVTTNPTAVITEQTRLGELPKVQQTQVTQPTYTISESPVVHSQRYQDQLRNQPEQVNYRESQTDLRPQRPHKPSRDQYRRKKPSTAAYEPTPTEAPVQLPETSVPVTLHKEEVPIQTTATSEFTTLPSVVTQKPRTRRPGSPLRRRRPTTTTPEPITEVDDYLKYDRPEEVKQQLDTTRRRRIKPTQATYEESVTEKKANIRKRPGHRNRVNPGEPFEAEIVTEIIHTPLNTYKTPTESIQNYNEYNQFVTNQPNGQQFDYTSQKFLQVDEQQEDTTQPIPVEYYTESTRTNLEDVPNNDNYHHQNADQVTNIPLEDLFVRTEGNYFDRATPVSSTSSSVSSIASVTTTPSTTTSTEPSTTQAPQISSSTIRSHKIRPMRYGNTTRPRFSIKDYKSRLDYKTRMSQTSSTEASSTPASSTKQRGSSYKNLSQQNGDTARETPGRYKYMSRASYRTTSPSPSVSRDPERDQGAEDGTSSTTERNHRFVPKRRPVSGNVYRSRISGTTSTPNRSNDGEIQSKPSTARSENVFSSSVRRRPTMKSRLSAKETSTVAYHGRKEAEATEMAAEETSFYSAVTTMSTTRVAANEIPVEKEETGSTSLPADKNPDESEIEASFHAENERPSVEPVASSTAKNEDVERPKETDASEQHTTMKTEETSTALNENKETSNAYTTDEEELFAKASQSVADLTSSASALYDKPGMFKAVSPETRVVANHFKIPTDEPTLPIEAFFQELSKKS